MSDNGQSPHRWRILALAGATHTFAYGIPFSCMPVLFKEISEDLSLNLIQIGTVWGMVSLSGLFVALIGGLAGDRFGGRIVLSLGCCLVGLAGGLRGLSSSFASLAATVFVFGLLISIIPVNVRKTIGTWFRGQNLGVANGVASMGMGIGLTLGPLISATVMSPLLGGWRNVLFLYGGFSLVIGILWLCLQREPHRVDSALDYSNKITIGEALSRLIRMKELWLLGFILMCRRGCIVGLVGYLPLYLRGQGWTPASADGTLASFYAASTMAVIPVCLLSDSLGSRKAVLLSALVTAFVSIGLLPVAHGMSVWILMIMVGIFFDGFMAITLTIVQETAGVGPKYSGAAMGLVLTISHPGAFVSPPLGNSLANISIGLPFTFWAVLSAVALVALIFTKETGQRKIKSHQRY